MARAAVRVRSTASAITVSIVHGDQFGQRLAALEPGQVDQLADQPAEPVGLVRDAAGEALHGLRVVGGVLDRLGEEGQRADRGLQLVPDVGHEVAADRLDAAGLGHVLRGPGRPARAAERAAVQPDAVHADAAAGRSRPGRPAGGRRPGGCHRRGPPAPGPAGRAPAAGCRARCRAHGRRGWRAAPTSSTSTKTTAGSMRSSSRRARAASGRDGTPRPGAPRRVVAEAEDDRGGHHPAQDEADHQGDQRTHAPMLGRSGPDRPFRAVDPGRVSVHLRVGARSPAKGIGRPGS